MGLFDVNMPLIYGEGEKAFMRLQEQIIRDKPDDSIFAWSCGGFQSVNILAQSPDLFKKSGDVIRIRPRAVKRAPYSMTNLGLAIEVACKTFSFPFDGPRRSPEVPEMESAILQLNCRRLSEPETCLAINLVRLGGFYVRQDLNVVDKRPLEGLKTVYIMTRFLEEVYDFATQKKNQRFAVRFCPGFERRFQSTFMSVELTISSNKLLGQQSSGGSITAH